MKERQKDGEEKGRNREWDKEGKGSTLDLGFVGWERTFILSVSGDPWKCYLLDPSFTVGICFWKCGSLTSNIRSITCELIRNTLLWTHPRYLGPETPGRKRSHLCLYRPSSTFNIKSRTAVIGNVFRNQTVFRNDLAIRRHLFVETLPTLHMPSSYLSNRDGGLLVETVLSGRETGFTPEAHPAGKVLFFL